MVMARRKELAPYHISPQQAHILLMLHELGRKSTLRELANYAERGINTLSEQMTNLENDGLVEKNRETPKSTLLSFGLTKKGIELCDCISEMRADEEIMSVLSEEERQQLISILKKILKNEKIPD